MDDSPLAAARALLRRRVASAESAEQDRLARLVDQLLDVITFANLLRALPDVSDSEQLARLEQERATLAESVASLLAAWRLGGGEVRLLAADASTPSVATGATESEQTFSGDRPSLVAAPYIDGVSTPDAEQPVDGDPVAAEVVIPPEVRRLLDDGAGTEEAAGTARPEPEAALPAEALSRLQEYFAGGGAPAAGDGPGVRAEPDRGAMLARLRAAVAVLVLPAEEGIAGGAWLGEIDRLDDGLRDLDDRWGPLPAAEQRALAGYFAAYARHVQDFTPETADLGSRRRLDNVFHALSQFMRTYWPGTVNGLARLHRPAGSSWLDDARAHLRGLREVAGLVDADLAKPASDGRATEVDLDVFLRDEGFVTEEGRALARAALAEAKLSQPRKRRMVSSKVDRARALFRELRPRLCSNPTCATIRAGLFALDTPTAAVESGWCDICHGSNNRRAALLLALRMRERALRRLLVVGGSDDSRAELERLLGDYLELRLVVAAGVSRSLRDAHEDMGWAEVMAIWGGTELDHKVSDLYKDPPTGVIVVRLNRRGIEALAQAAIERLAA